MAKAEDFKRDFDRRVPTGTALSAVDEYLRGQRLQVGRSIGSTGGGELFIEVFRETSPSWYCGTGSVGLIARFAPDQRLESTSVQSWSFDCP
jgi:hypothetical protein